MTGGAVTALAPGPACDLVPCSRFGISALTEAYNQTRVDYLIPMPMNAERLREYIAVYDVDLDRSLVAVDGERILGLGMLGRRSDRAWITRLGVLPTRRRRGVGETIVQALLAEADAAGCRRVALEVIVRNDPAYALFVKCGFAAQRELVVLRRPPLPAAGAPAAAPAEVRWLSPATAMRLLRQGGAPPPWTNAVETFEHAGDTIGLRVGLADGGAGALVCRRQRYYLSHLVIHTEAGDPATVGSALLGTLHAAFPDLDTHAENLVTTDPHLDAFRAAGYIESFRRVEMVRMA
ncbi:hypothetical protein DCC79_05950 [bacterium]|nr:GNAT family N-acetyltransferase [Chloroflexi bacterium CFX6]RIL11089.1 MAG: hypothetical protein DCC79_05950 [bacterium]